MQTNNYKILDYDLVLDAKFGKEGTPERIQAEESAYSFYAEKQNKTKETEAYKNRTREEIISACCESVRRKQEWLEKTDDITKTAHYKEAMDDVKNGRVFHCDSVDDLFKELGINV